MNQHVKIHDLSPEEPRSSNERGDEGNLLDVEPPKLEPESVAGGGGDPPPDHQSATARSAEREPRTRRKRRPRKRRTDTDATPGKRDATAAKEEATPDETPTGSATASDKGARPRQTQAQLGQPETPTPTEPGREPRTNEAEKKRDTRTPKRQATARTNQARCLIGLLLRKTPYRPNRLSRTERISFSGARCPCSRSRARKGRQRTMRRPSSGQPHSSVRL